MGVSMMAVRLRPASLYIIHPQSSSGRARKATAYGEGSNPSWGYHAQSLGYTGGPFWSAEGQVRFL